MEQHPYSSTLTFFPLLLYASISFKYLSLSLRASSSYLPFCFSVKSFHISDKILAISATERPGFFSRTAARFSPQKWKYDDLQCRGNLKFRSRVIIERIYLSQTCEGPNIFNILASLYSCLPYKLFLSNKI